MAPVLEALMPRLSLTASNYKDYWHNKDDWLNFINAKNISKIMKKINFEIPINSVDSIGNRMLSGTSKSGVHIENLGLEVFYELASPMMVPRNEFNVNFIIEKIEKGLPSICDEVELW